MLMFARIFRGVIGFAGLVFLKASAQPAIAFFLEGDAPALPPFVWRFLVGVTGVVAFFYLRAPINRAYIAQGNAPGPLHSKWKL